MIRSSHKTCLLIAGLMLAVLLPGCRRTPDEAQVREAIAAVASAAEAGAASGVVAPISDDFDGNAGEFDRRALANTVRLLALRGEHIGVSLGPVSIEHRGERMMVRFAVTLSSSRHLLPDRAGVYRVESAWRREGGHWRCYSASWK
ncbi:MAG: hypothetical protein OQK79_00940 [Rhodanobacter sp.]|nr:hypothetical protein [Rhodanobacter sp.]